MDFDSDVSVRLSADGSSVDVSAADVARHYFAVANCYDKLAALSKGTVHTLPILTRNKKGSKVEVEADATAHV